MTDNPFMPAGAEEAAPATSDNRRVLLVGGLAAAVALAGGGYYLLAGSSSSDTSAAVAPVVHHQAVPQAKKAPAKAPAKAAIIPVTSSVPIGRNPFKPLYVVPAVSTTTATSPSTTTASSPTTTSSSTGTSSVSNAPYALTLVSITGGTGGYAHQFTFKVGSLSKTVIAAQKFGNYGELQVLTYTRTSAGKVTGAVVQVGDADPTTVAIGQKITVQ